MNMQRYVILIGLLSIGTTLAPAETMDAFLVDLQALPAKERTARIEKAIETASDVNAGAYRLLLIDAKYEDAKRQIASQMLSLAESRASSQPDVDSTPFTKQAAYYDTMAILQSIPLAWLTTIERERALILSAKIESELGTAQGPNTDNTLEESRGEPKASIDDIIAMINDALEQAQREDLALISEATPNGSIRSALEKCEAAREALMAQSQNQTDSSSARWEAAMLHLSKAISVFRQRQVLKYALWAEGRYRESSPENVSQQMNEQEAMAFYKRLSEVNVSLVAEPSLAREITTRLYELYDSINSPKAKERVRYDSIIKLDKRKTLDDF